MKRNRLMFIITVVLVLGFAASTFFSLRSMSKLISDNNRETAIVYANEIDDSIESALTSAKQISLTMNNTFMQELIKNIDVYQGEEFNVAIGNYLSFFVKEFDCSTAFMVIDKNQSYYTEKGFFSIIDKNNSNDAWYFPFVESGKDFELNIDANQSHDNIITVYCNCRMENANGEFIGVCGVGVPLDVFTALIKSYEERGLDVKLVSSSGLIQLSNDDSNVNQSVSGKVQALINKYSEDDGYAYEELESDGYSIVKYIPDCDWYLVITDSKSSLTTYKDIIFENIIALLITLAVLVFVDFMLGRENSKNSALKEESETDRMTSLKNIRTYDLDINKITSSKYIKDVSIFMVDINCLKAVNDNSGHAAGDELIVGTAKILSDFFKGHGDVYRIGGDKFVGITREPVDDPDEVIEQLKAEADKWTGELIDNLSFSVGIACADKDDCSTVEELQELAHKRMYDDKDTFYRENRNNRKRKQA